MRRLLVALSIAGLLLAGCGRPPATVTPLDLERIALNRQIITNCEENQWRPCASGFVREAQSPILRQILVVSGDGIMSNETPRYDEISNTELLVKAAPGPAGDQWLSGATLILHTPTNQTVWEAADVEHANQRWTHAQ